jgi:LmbE family N-acetylglucosaminyl deacetylase
MFSKILILAPHTDDGEFGCGASITKFIEDGKEVFYAAFSAAEKSVPKEMPDDILRSEVKNATTTLGIKRENLFVLEYPVREFPKYRQDILEDMIKFNREIQPDLVILPSTSDTHQDHQVVVKEGFRAFKKTTMLGYEIPWNNLTFVTSAFVFLEQRHLEAKINALKCYISQLGRSYVTEEFIRSLAITRGAQIGTKYAETFEVIRWIIR